jgi:hypothetical protein
MYSKCGILYILHETVKRKDKNPCTYEGYMELKEADIK